MDQWYCRSKKGESGPFSESELRYLVRTGVVPNTAEVRLGVSSPWMLLKDTAFAHRTDNSKPTQSPPKPVIDKKNVAEENMPEPRSWVGPTSSTKSADNLSPTSHFPRSEDWMAALILTALLLFIAAITFWLWSKPSSMSPDEGQANTESIVGKGIPADPANAGAEESTSDEALSEPGLQSDFSDKTPDEPTSDATAVSNELSQEHDESLKGGSAVLKPQMISENAFRIRLPSPDELAETKVTDAKPTDGKMPLHAPKLRRSNLQGRSGEGKAAAIERSGGSVESEQAVALALKWLKSIQQSDGSWSFQNVGRDAVKGSMDSPLAATSLAVLCFLGAGNTTKSGPEKAVVSRAFAFLKSEVEKAPAQRETLYVHALVMMSFSELAAMEPSETEAKDLAQKLLKFIENSQDPRGGGWRYSPRQPGDLSVTGWQIMALQSGKTCGLDVSEATISKSHRFLDSVSSDSGAAYRYTPANSSTQCMTAVGLLSRIYLGWPRNTRPLQNGIEELVRTGPDRNDIYLNYYATLAVHHFGGQPWEQWNERLRPQLIESQISKGDAAGSWQVTDPHSHAGGQIYQTCLSVLCLEVYYRYLPIFESDIQPTD